MLARCHEVNARVAVRARLIERSELPMCLRCKLGTVKDEREALPPVDFSVVGALGGGGFGGCSRWCWSCPSLSRNSSPDPARCETQDDSARTTPRAVAPSVAGSADSGCGAAVPQPRRPAPPPGSNRLPKARADVQDSRCDASKGWSSDGGWSPWVGNRTGQRIIAGLEHDYAQLLGVERFEETCQALQMLLDALSRERAAPTRAKVERGRRVQSTSPKDPR